MDKKQHMEPKYGGDCLKESHEFAVFYGEQWEIIVTHSKINYFKVQIKLYWEVCNEWLIFVFQDGRTALHYAAANGFVQCTYILVTSGVNINAFDKVFEWSWTVTY